MGTVCCSREVESSSSLFGEHAPLPKLPKKHGPAGPGGTSLEVEKGRDSQPSQIPRKNKRTSLANGRSVSEQCGFQVYKAAENETEWLNEVVRRLWEYIEQSIRTLLFEDITARIREECADVPILKGFAFTNCTFGSDRPTFSQMKVRSKGDLLEVFVEIDWDAPMSEIAVSLGSMKLGMQHIQLRGSILLVLSPLLGKMPLAGGLSVTFPDPPMLEWQWTGAAGMGVTGIAGALQEVMALNIKEIIVHAIFEKLVVPSRVYIDIAGLAKERHLPLEKRIENYRSPDPIGVLQLTILEARDLPVADFGLAGGSSDPYVVVKIGTTTWTTLKRVKTLNPKWGKAHSMDFLVYHMEQKLFVDVFDSDLLSKDDLLGYVSLDGKRPRIRDLDEEQAEKEWQLHEGGKLRMICRFRDLSEDFVEACFLNCNEECRPEGLIPSKSLRACSLCGEGSFFNFIRCGACFADAGRYECSKCGFRCCGRCWQKRRPAAAILRVCLREGLVPLEDAKTGVVLGVNIEGGETQWSAMSVRPSYEEITEQSEAQRWIQNLCSRFDRASVASCLEISAQRLQQALDEARDNIHATQALDILGQEPVIWDHALHFLLRDPHEELCATVVYRSTRCKFERQLRLWGEGGDGSNHNQRYNLPTSGEPKELTWTFPLDVNKSASVFVEVTLQGLCR